MIKSNEIKEHHNDIFCPGCGHKIDVFCESTVQEPFEHYNAMAGLLIYGPYSSHKTLKCMVFDDFIHFEFSDGEHRLVKLACMHDKIDGEKINY